MLNFEIAKVLYDIADILEIMKVEWKPRAYRAAARSVESLQRSIEDIYRELGLKGLEEIPGIGEGIGKKIAEYIESGKIKEYEKLKQKIPVGLATLVEIEGLGPKKAYRLWKELGIKSLEDLRSAIKAHKIAKLSGFGPKSEANIAASIQMFVTSKKRFLLGEALPMAKIIIENLEKLPEVKHISEAGSLRRRKETIGDIDILVTVSRPSAAKKIMDVFTKLPEVQRVLAKGPTKSTVVLRTGQQSDVRVIADKVFGAALNYFTGNVDHNIEMRRIAISKGYKLSEYGLFKRKTERLVGGHTEEELYKKLGLRYIEPELREMRGEIEAARRGKLPDLVNLMDVKGDLHCHTKWSDGSNTITEMAEAAKKLGYEYVAITDHSKSDVIARGMDEKKLQKYLDAIDEARKKVPGIKILSGSEVYIHPDGSLDFTDKVLEKLDVVVASIHRNFKLSREQQTERLLKVIENGNVHILGHLTTRQISRRPMIDFNTKEVFRAAAKNNVLLEINGSPDRLDLPDNLVKEALEMGCKFAINSDAHNADQLRFMEYGTFVARRGWCEPRYVANTLSFAKLAKYF
jgi:DNA polymerase (family 10)